MTCIVPVGHHLLVKPLPLEKQSKGGIILAHDERKEKAQIRGTVVAIGPNAWKAYDDGHQWVFVGEEVFYAQYGGYLIRDPETDEEFRLLNDQDVCAVVCRDGTLRPVPVAPTPPKKRQRKKANNPRVDTESEAPNG